MFFFLFLETLDSSKINLIKLENLNAYGIYVHLLILLYVISCFVMKITKLQKKFT